jgi:hypothetical protein
VILPASRALLLLTPALPFSRVSFANHLLEVPDVNPDVLGRGADLAVPEDLLHVTDVSSSLKKVRRAGMTENVGMKPL